MLVLVIVIVIVIVIRMFVQMLGVRGGGLRVWLEGGRKIIRRLVWRSWIRRLWNWLKNWICIDTDVIFVCIFTWNQAKNKSFHFSFKSDIIKIHYIFFISTSTSVSIFITTIIINSILDITHTSPRIRICIMNIRFLILMIIITSIPLSPKPW